MHRKISRLLIFVLLISLILPIIVQPVYAGGGYVPPDTIAIAGGGPSGTHTSKAVGNWNSIQSGFRITVVDAKAYPVFKFMGKNSLDLVFSRNNLSNMDYYCSGDKISGRGAIDYKLSNMDSKVYTLQEIHDKYTSGELDIKIPDPDALDKNAKNWAMNKMNADVLNKPLKKENGKWLTAGTAIRDQFFGSGKKANPDCLLYAILTLKTVRLVGTGKYNADGKEIMVDKGKFLWQPNLGAYPGCTTFTQNDIDRVLNLTITPLQLMAEKGMFVEVEPIIWNSLRLTDGKPDTEAVKYAWGIYGTQTKVGNCIQWLINNGKFKPEYAAEFGGVDQSLFGKFGRKCMVSSNVSSTQANMKGVITFYHPQKPIAGGAPLIITGPDSKSVESESVKVTNKEVMGRAPGWALHIYFLYSDPKPDLTHTFDPPNTPGKAPDPLKGLKPDDLKKVEPLAHYNIVKVYQTRDSVTNVITYDGTFTKDLTVPKIVIEDEPEYKVKEWKYGLPDPDNPVIDGPTGTKWGDDPIKAIAPIDSKASGTTVATVDIANKDDKDEVRTLYVLLEKPTKKPLPPPPPPPPAPSTPASNIITESQLVKAISTDRTLVGNNWGSYNFSATLEAAVTSHKYTACCGICKYDQADSGTCDHMRRIHGDNQVSATFTGLHSIQPIETKSHTGYSPVFASTVISGIHNAPSVKLEAVVGDGSYDWNLSPAFADHDGISYFTTIWRQPLDSSTEDVVTPALYKKISTNPNSYGNITTLFTPGNVPTQPRAVAGDYISNLNAILGISISDDYATSQCRCDCSTHHTSTSDTKTVVRTTSTGGTTAINFDAGITTEVYTGKTKPVAAAKLDNFTGQIMSLNGNLSNVTAAFIAQCKSNLNFYPYVRMSYMVTSDNYAAGGYPLEAYSGLNRDTGADYLNDRTVYILSDKQSKILPSNAVEVGWYNKEKAEKNVDGYGLQMTSQQWSLHAKATNGDGWRNPNQVLPGGAIYNLSTKGTETLVKAVTYSTLVDVPSRSWVTLSDTSEFTTASVISNNDAFIGQLKDCLEYLRLVEWVNRDPSQPTAWENPDTGVKIAGASESLKPLGLGTSASADKKYLLVNGTPDNKGGPREADLDIMASGYETMVYKVFTSPEGNVYVAMASMDTKSKSLTPTQLNSLVNTLANTCGTNLGIINNDPNIKESIVRIGVKNQTKAQIIEGLKNSQGTTNDYFYLHELNTKTGIIDNVLDSVTRNVGSDSLAVWVNDGHWYNEAFDGLYVVQQSMTYKLGLMGPGIRSAVLDPNLCPASQGKSDQFSKAHISQFRLDSRSTSPLAKLKPDGYVGTFYGIDVTMPYIESMYESRPFYIPNANVQDLH